MQQVVNAFVLGGIYVLFALGLSLTWGTLNVLNLAHGSVFMFAGFTCYYITSRTHANLSLPVLILIGIGVGCAMELFLDIAIFRPIRRRTKDLRQTEMSMLLASIGAGVIPVAIAESVTHDTSFTLTQNPIPVHLYNVGGVVISSIEIIIVAVALVLTVALALWIQRSRNGRALRALAFDAETSGLMGISEGRLSAVTLLISGATAGAAGVFLAVFLDSLNAQSGQDLLLKAFAAVVLGGVGSVWGTLIGAYVLASGETIVAATSSGLWTDAVSFGLIIGNFAAEAEWPPGQGTGGPDMTSFYVSHQVLFQTTAIYVVLALSFQVVLRTGVFSFASVGFFGIGAYAAANLVIHGVPGVAALFVVVIGCYALGYILALPFVRLRGLYLGMVTFAFDQIVLVVANNGGTLTGGPVGLFGVPVESTTGELFIIAAIVVVLMSQLERRSIGRTFEAIRTDENLARSMGIETVRNRNFIFALSAALGGLAGVMDVYNFSTFAPTGFGFDLIVAGLTMAVVGGVDSWLGAAIGAIFVVWFPSIATFATGMWKSIIYGILVILVVSYEPGGVFGLGRRGVRWLIAFRRSRTTPPGVGESPGGVGVATTHGQVGA